MGHQALALLKQLEAASQAPMTASRCSCPPRMTSGCDDAARRRFAHRAQSRRSRLELFDQTQLAHACATKVRDAVRTARAVSGGCVDAQRPRVLLVHEQECLRATGSSQRVVSGSQESAANPATGVGGMDEQKEHLTILHMNGCVPDDAVRIVDGDQQHVRRDVVSHEVIPVLGREQGLRDEFA